MGCAITFLLGWKTMMPLPVRFLLSYTPPFHTHTLSLPSCCKQLIWSRPAFQDLVHLLPRLRPPCAPLPLPGFRGAERPSFLDVRMLCRVFQHFPWSPALEKHLRQRNFSLTSEQVNQVLHLLKGNVRQAFNFFIWAGQQRGVCYAGEALDILREIFGQHLDSVGPMLRDMESERRYIPIQAFMILLDLYAQNNMVEPALEIFQKTVKYGCRPDVDAYNLMLDILVSVGRIEVAQEIFEQMKADRLCSPNTTTLRTMLYGLGTAGMVTEAYKLIDSPRFVDEIPTMEAHTRLIDGLCVAGRIDQAEEAVIEMHELGLQPDINVYTSLVSGHAKAGNMVEAYRYFIESVKDKVHTIKADISSDLIIGFCNVNDVRAAHKLMSEMIDNGFAANINLYNGLISSASRQGLWDMTQMLMDEMATRGIDSNAETYNILVAACADTQLEKAVTYLREMIGKGFCTTEITFTALLSGLSKANQPDKWLEVLEVIEGMEETIIS